MPNASRWALLWIGTSFFMTAAIAIQAHAANPRRTPIVEAVEKTRAGIVLVSVDKSDGVGGKRTATGTGIVVDERGYIVTSRHVVAGASSIHVTFGDAKEFPAHMVANERGTDLAILRATSPKPLRALPLGPGSDLLVGETVIAIGNPYGYRHTVSRGIISALDRDITMPSGEVLGHLIQTDAGINPGNSGGPLLNINGEVIGINVAVRDGARGIAFAINIDVVKSMLLRHLNCRTLAGTYHGLACAERVLPEGSSRQKVVVKTVAHETPAAAAGLQSGDEICRVAGRVVANPFDIERALWSHQPGEALAVEVLRHGTVVPLRLTLQRDPRSDRLAVAESVPGP